LKKFASHFFNPAVGVTGENKAANPVTGEKYYQWFDEPTDILLQFLDDFFKFHFIKTFSK
jgi:hypothetical protein